MQHVVHHNSRQPSPISVRIHRIYDGSHDVLQHTETYFTLKSPHNHVVRTIVRKMKKTITYKYLNPSNLNNSLKFGQNLDLDTVLESSEHEDHEYTEFTN
jgi:hypothetical protein